MYSNTFYNNWRVGCMWIEKAISWLNHRNHYNSTLVTIGCNEG